MQYLCLKDIQLICQGLEVSALLTMCSNDLKTSQKTAKSAEQRTSVVILTDEASSASASGDSGSGLTVAAGRANSERMGWLERRIE